MAKSTRLRIPLAVVALFSILVLNLVSVKVSAAPADCVWSMVDIPAEGRNGKWQLAAGSDVPQLTVARDGTLYAYATPSGTTDTIFKSTDGGVSWSAAGQVAAYIAGIAVAPDDANVVYYAGNSSVYRSADGGTSFSVLSGIIRVEPAAATSLLPASLSLF